MGAATASCACAHRALVLRTAPSLASLSTVGVRAPISDALSSVRGHFETSAITPCVAKADARRSARFVGVSGACGWSGASGWPP